MDFKVKPPMMVMPPGPGLPNLSEPPPNMLIPPPNINANNPLGPPMNHPRPPMGNQFGSRHHFRPFLNMSRSLPGPLGNMTLEDFDGKRLRKSVMRKTVDYNSSIIKELENRIWQRDCRDRRALQPDVMYYPELMPPPSYPDNPINCVTTRFVKTATNKMRCPIFCMAWTPEGRRLVTGASSGEFTLWNGLTFNFETILQAHDSPVRTMVWSHNDSWMVTGDHAGYVKYWQSNMNNVKMFQAHKEALRGISFSPTDSKFVTCSDDGTLRIWDFYRYQEERVLRGHGADVKCVHWHPQKGLIISGSKDNQQPIKLWDPKSGQSLATLHAHKSTVMDLKWNDNGNWLITASRDHLLKLFDLRNLSQEVQTFRGHKKEASSVAWHPHHEGLFCSGGSDGAIMFWHVGADKEVGAIEQAHDSIVWTLAWHPLGHILCSGSNDHTSKFWTRNRPGDQMRDKYNLNTLPPGITGLDDIDLDEPAIIPGMGPDDKVEPLIITDNGSGTEIPGLDLDPTPNITEDKSRGKKVPFSKPIPRNFQAQWNETGGEEESVINDVISKLAGSTPGAVPLQKITPNAIIIYGKLIPVEAGSKLETAINEGPESLQKYIDSGQIEELHDVMPHDEEREGHRKPKEQDKDDGDKEQDRERDQRDNENDQNSCGTRRESSAPVWEKPPDLDEDMRLVYNMRDEMHDSNLRNNRERDIDFRVMQTRPPVFEPAFRGNAYFDEENDDERFPFPGDRNFMPNGNNGNFFPRNGGGLMPNQPFMGNGGGAFPPGRMDFMNRPPGPQRSGRPGQSRNWPSGRWGPPPSVGRNRPVNGNNNNNGSNNNRANSRRF